VTTEPNTRGRERPRVVPLARSQKQREVYHTRILRFLNADSEFRQNQRLKKGKNEVNETHDSNT
jgi:hypothetical protein